MKQLQPQFSTPKTPGTFILEGSGGFLYDGSGTSHAIPTPEALKDYLQDFPHPIRLLLNIPSESFSTLTLPPLRPWEKKGWLKERLKEFQDFSHGWLRKSSAYVMSWPLDLSPWKTSLGNNLQDMGFLSLELSTQIPKDLSYPALVGIKTPSDLIHFCLQDSETLSFIRKIPLRDANGPHHQTEIRELQGTYTHLTRFQTSPLTGYLLECHDDLPQIQTEATPHDIQVLPLGEPPLSAVLSQPKLKFGMAPTRNKTHWTGGIVSVILGFLLIDLYQDYQDVDHEIHSHILPDDPFEGDDDLYALSKYHLMEQEKPHPKEVFEALETLWPYDSLQIQDIHWVPQTTGGSKLSMTVKCQALLNTASFERSLQKGVPGIKIQGLDNLSSEGSLTSNQNPQRSSLILELAK